MSYVCHFILVGPLEHGIGKGKSAWQTSIQYNGAAGRAVDGQVTKTIYSDNSCTATTSQHNPRWAVELGNRRQGKT